MDGEGSEAKLSECAIVQFVDGGLRTDNKKGRIGECKMEGGGGGRVYADNVLLLAEEEGGMRSILERLEGYRERKGLVVNTDKSKIMRCRKGRGRLRK